MGVSAPSLHRESTDSLIARKYTCRCRDNSVQARLGTSNPTSGCKRSGTVGSTLEYGLEKLGTRAFVRLAFACTNIIGQAGASPPIVVTLERISMLSSDEAFFCPRASALRAIVTPAITW